MSDSDILFKAVIIGDSNVGKSSIMTRYCDNIFNLSNISSTGIDFRYKTVNIDDKKIKFQLWDTPGQEKFRTLTTAYYKNAHIIILVFDITNKISFQNINRWLNEIKQILTPNVKIFLIGNKCDELKREVTTEEVTLYAQELNIIYIETSAKTGDGITDIFHTIGQNMMMFNTESSTMPVVCDL